MALENIHIIVNKIFRVLLSWLPRFPPRVWLRTSDESMKKAERNILGELYGKMKHRSVLIDNDTKIINTVIINEKSEKIPLVLLHGIGSGIGLWVLNYEALSKNRPLYAIDVLGFGRSSRISFPETADETEATFIESIESWRKQMGLERFILLGHSLGGYLAAAYAIQYPTRIRHLILVDPWGFREQQEAENGETELPPAVQTIVNFISRFTPLTAIRLLGPFGPFVIRRLRPDIIEKFSEFHIDDTVVQYIYHCNVQLPSGEVGFKHISQSFGWAIYPMIHRIQDLSSHVPISMIYGSRSWMDSATGDQVKNLRRDSYVDVQVINRAGHHVYADQPFLFNKMVNKICQIVDQKFDLNTNSSINAHKQLRSVRSIEFLRRSHSLSEVIPAGRLRAIRRTFSECPPENLHQFHGRNCKRRQSETVTGHHHPPLTEEEESGAAKYAEVLKESNEESEEEKPVVFHLE